MNCCLCRHSIIDGGAAGVCCDISLTGGRQPCRQPRVDGKAATGLSVGPGRTISITRQTVPPAEAILNLSLMGWWSFWAPRTKDEKATANLTKAFCTLTRNHKNGVFIYGNTYMLDRVRNLGKGLGVPLQPSTEEPRWALEDDEAPPPHGPWTVDLQMCLR